MPCGRRHRRTTAVKWWAGDARLQLCQRLRHLCRQLHSPHHHRRRLPHHPQPNLPLRQGQLILSIALLILKTLGQRIRRRGAAGFITAVAHRLRHRRCRCRCRFFRQCSRFFRQRSRQCRRGQQIPTIARMGSRIGSRAGLLQRRNGAVGCMARVARPRAVGASAAEAHRASRTIATLDLPTGWLVGPSPRRHGVVQTRARAALQQLEDVLET